MLTAIYRKAGIKLAHVWFADEKDTSTPFPNGGVDLFFMHGLSTPLPQGILLYMQHSLIKDLRQTEEELYRSFGKHLQKELRRAARDNTEIRFADSADILRSSALLDQCGELYETMFSDKGMRVRFNRKLAEEYARRNALWILTAVSDGEVCGFEALLHDDHRARGWITAFSFREETSSERRQFIGRAHKLLNWEAIRLCRRMGCVSLDLGGVNSFDSPNGIAQFKLLFERENRVAYGNYLVAGTPVGKLILTAYSAYVSARKKLDEIRNDVINKFQLNYWNVGIIEQSAEKILAGASYEIQWVQHSYKDRFFADPFLYQYDERFYRILAEEMLFTQGKGTVVLLTVDRESKRLVDRTPFLQDEFHLSYPNFDGTDLVPENYRSGGLNRFSFSGGAVEKQRILDVPMIDPTFVEYNGKRWLFGTTNGERGGDNRDLSIFYEKDGRFLPHRGNPVKADARSSRSGGHFFYVHGNLYRPAQNCEHTYGEDIRIMKVLKLTTDEYAEEPVKVIHTRDSSRYNQRCHTFNVYDGFILVDGFERSTQIAEKIRTKAHDVWKKMRKK